MRNGFLYGLALQWRLDIRSRTMLVTCYLVPLIFFGIMGGIFTSLMPETRETLISSMTVMGVSMGALIGVPPSVAETYGGDIRRMYRANRIPLSAGLVSMVLSAFAHLLLMGIVLLLAAPVAFGAWMPTSIPQHIGRTAVFLATSLALGSAVGLAVRNQAKLTMVSQLFFLPSILLSGILFPPELLPEVLGKAGRIFPSYWGYRLMAGCGSFWENVWPLLLIGVVSVAVCGFLLRRLEAE